MQPLKLTIPGQYWDSYIYSGRLYLFGMDGNIVTLDWDRLINSWDIDDALRLPLECAFLRSDYLYGNYVQKMFRDPEVRDLVRSKFIRVSNRNLTVSRKGLSIVKLGEQDNKFLFPHSDCEIYRRILYVSAPSGIMKGSAGRKTKYPISTRPERKWDAPVYGISASWGSLALAAGDEGLFELSIEDRWDMFDRNYVDPKNITQEHCNQCNWVFHSIFGSTESGGFLASFNKEYSMNEGDQYRIFDRVMNIEELWKQEGYAWGVQDKLCLATNGSINVLKYQPWEQDPALRIRFLGEVKNDQGLGGVLSASSATFGVVVERENALIVYPSVGDPVTLFGEPVNWRVFPRAKHYENQLHVIWNDHMDIFSFNHDYLVDQEKKILGVSVMQERSWRNRSPNMYR